jgi:type IV secretory pathway VirB10-like protein
MNSIWLKIAGVAVVAVVVLVVVGRFKSDKLAESRPSEKNKTFDQVVERDRQFAQAPKPAEPQPTEPPQPPPAATPPAPPAASSIILPSSITQKTALYFKPLSEEDDIAAQQLLPWAQTSRSIGRLPMMGTYGPMVRACRDILTRWPDSAYAFRAKQLLEDVSTSGRAAGQNITQQEMDISKFFKQRPGTQPYPVEPVRR